MSIFSRIRNVFKKDDDTEKQIVRQLAESYQTKKEQGEENPIDTTVSQIMDIINRSDTPDLAAQRILKAALESEAMPDRIPEKLSVMISKSDIISDKVITNAVQESDIEVPDKVIEAIIEEGDIEQKERDNLIQNIGDQDIAKDRIKSELNLLYKNCRLKRDDEIVARIQELRELIENNNIDMSTRTMVERIVAKKMAENIYSEQKKGTRIYTLAQVLPVQKMFEIDLPSKVEEEYKKIEEERGEKEGRFNKDGLENQIIAQLAKNIGYKYRTSGTFMIPQSVKMKTLSEEKERIFIKKIQAASAKELSEEEITEIKEEIRGIIKNPHTREMMIVEALREMPNNERYMDLISEIASDEKKLRTLYMIRESGLIDNLGDVHHDRRKGTIEAISDTVKKRNEKLKEEEAKEKQETNVNITVENDKEDR